MKQLDNLEEKVFNLELSVKELRETIEDNVTVLNALKNYK